MAKNQKPAAEVQEERFAEVRKQFETADDFRASIAGENEKTLRASAKDFGINLQGRDSKNDILDTIVEAVYPAVNANAPAGAEGGEGEIMPAHDDETNEAAQDAADKVGTDDDTALPDAAIKASGDSTTISASEMPGGEPDSVVATRSPQNPNEKFTENLEAKRERTRAELAGETADTEENPAE